MRLLITSSQPHQGLRLINSGRSLFTSKKKEWADYKTEAGPAAARPSYRHKFRSFLFLLLSIYVTSDLHQTCWFAANVVAVRYVAGEVVLSKIDLCGATLATSTSDLTRTIRKKNYPVRPSKHACMQASALALFHEWRTSSQIHPSAFNSAASVCMVLPGIETRVPLVRSYWARAQLECWCDCYS
jgi:hypothetical protein